MTKILIKNCTTNEMTKMNSWCLNNVGNHCHEWVYHWVGNFERNIEYSFKDSNHAALFALTFL